jgi:hypothetical protein
MVELGPRPSSLVFAPLLSEPQDEDRLDQTAMDDGNDSFQKFTHLGQAIDNQRLSHFGLSVH